MSIQSDIQKLEPGALVEMFELDATPIGGVQYYFHNGVNELGSDVVWQGVTYARFPIEASGFETRGHGTAPRPAIRASNINGLLGAIVRVSDDLVGARLIRRRTFAQYLDAVNFTGGVNASADPNAHLPDEIYYVDRQSAETTQHIEWELASVIDVGGIVLPRRQFIANLCMWEYRHWDPVAGDFDYTRAGECGYNGTQYYNEQDEVCSAAQDKCSKRLSGCRLRFGQGNPLPFGGFPSCGLSRLK